MIGSIIHCSDIHMEQYKENFFCKDLKSVIFIKNGYKFVWRVLDLTYAELKETKRLLDSSTNCILND